MLRSRNLKKVLEQALTKEISVCAVFNADGVVLAHAASPQGIDTGNKDASRHSSSFATETGSPGRHPLFLAAQGKDPHGHASERVASHGSENPLNSHGMMRTSTTETNNLASGTATAAAGGNQRHPDDGQGTDDDSLASSFCDIHGDGLSGSGMREKLDDDLAIAANLWQSYEHLPNLIERKDRDADDYAGDGGSEMQDDVQSNSLQMVIIECAYGKAAVTRLGSYRLFLLSRSSTPLGMLKLKSDSMCRFLEECLHIT
ncbi:hypothetical protein IWW50_001186 [Coemansia erecta]|nr:hypothetical protein IWW50_001186 [Coemansia erecta]